MKVLVLGGDGMLGHKVLQEFRGRCETYATFRGLAGVWSRHPLYAEMDAGRIYGGVDARNIESVVSVVDRVRPDVVINCIGIVKQRREGQTAIPSIEVNSLFPLRLADLCERGNARLIHLSTDCVFSGEQGHYTETARPDPVDMYGWTKLLGELDRPGCVTLRTSMIGWELSRRAGLLEWFAAQRGRTIKGYRRALFTGLSTAVLAGLLGDLVQNWTDLSGLYHVAGAAISKHDLLVALREALGWQDVVIEPDESFHCNRSLVGGKFEAVTGWRPPAWNDMIAGLAAEWPLYERWRLAG